ncbi:hypothetical protein [Actinocorallia populi]|uniref:hypothetical protein n=1 Tax=Actinocorallia populi TaxID=2079200 RepID=UPI000D08FA6A|nr:hypothetical protein [Actinocorallia populi]
MAENEQDPAGNTQQFRSFAQREGGEPDPDSRTDMPAGLFLAVISLAALIAVVGAIMLIV